MVSRAEIERLRVEGLSISTSLIVRAAEARGITYKILPDKLVKLSDGTRSHFIKGTLVDCNSEVARFIANNKYLTRHLLRAEGIPTPRSMLLRNPAAWQQVLSSRLKFPLVVKPVVASHGHGATMNIHRRYVLKQAVERAFSYMKKKDEKNRVLVEEYFEGQDLRVLVLDGKVVSIVTRDPAHVIGDGVRTIRQLIEEFNSLWRSNIEYDLPLCPIPLDAEVTRRLAAAGYKISDIPEKHTKVYVRWNANASTGGRAIEVTDTVHPAIKELSVKISQVTTVNFSGVDLLVKDFTSPDTSERNVVVLEVNNSPGIDINQLPYQGVGKDVASAIIKVLFP